MVAHSKVYQGENISDFIYRVEYIIYSSITREQAIQMIMKEIERIYSEIASKIAQAYFGELKEYIVGKFTNVEGPFWVKIKEFFRSLIQDIKSFASKDDKNWGIISLVVGVLILVLWYLFPAIKKLIKKIFSFIKYGFSKFVNIIKKIFGLGKSEQKTEVPTLFEIYLKKKRKRKLIEMKLQKLDMLLNIYYSLT